MTKINNKSVLLVAWFFYPKLGGAEMIVLNQVRYLRDHGYKVAVLTSPVKNLESNDEFEGIKIFRRDFINSSISFRAEEISEELEAIFSKTNPSIVHFHNGSYPAASTNMDAGAKNIKSIFEFARAKNKKIVEHSHNAQLKNPNATEQLRKLDWDCVICVSNFVKSKWNEFGNNAQALEVVYNGIELKNFADVVPDPKVAELKKNDGEKLIFFPARVVSMSQGCVSKQKNFHLVIESCKKLLDGGIENFRLIAILNEPEKKKEEGNPFGELNELLQKFDLGGRMVFINTILPDDMPAAYAAVDVVCVPSIKETFGLVYVEAMASGKVAIASNTGGPSEYIKNGENGFAVDPKNPEELTNVLHRVLTDEKLYEKIRRNGLIAAKKFSVENMMEKIETIYQRLLEE